MYTLATIKFPHSRIKLRRLICFFVSTLVLLFGVQSYGATLTPLEIAPIVRVAPTLQWLKQGAGVESLWQVQSLPDSDWQVSEDDAMSLGLVSGSYWFRFALQVDKVEKPAEYVFHPHNASLNSIELYQQLPTGEIIQKGPIGTSYSYQVERDVDVEGNKFIVHLDQTGTYLFWVKVVHDGYLDVPIYMFRIDHYFSSELHNRFFSSIFYGFFLALGLYHLFYYLIMRDPIYLGLLMFVSGVALLFGCVDGVLFKYVWPQSSMLNGFALRVSVPLVSTSIVYLSFKFLQECSTCMRFKYLAWLVYAANFSVLIISFFLPVYVSLYISLAVSIATLVVVKMLAVCSFWVSRDSLSLIFLLSLSIFVVCSLVVALGVLGILPIDINNLIFSLKVVMSIQVLVFAIAIVLRIRVMNNERKKALDESKAKSDMLAKVSHELRTPLNGILGLSHIMKPLLVDDRSKQYNTMVTQSATALLSVINDLLDVSSINAGKFSLNEQPTNAVELLTGVAESIFTQIGKKSVIGKVTIDPLTPTLVIIDSDRLRQLLSNLIGNAVKFTERGSITVELQCLEQKNMYRFSIKDTGVGISKEQQQKIFNPYVFGRSINSSTFRSTGLGLFITSQLAKAMNTKIEFISEEGQGSHFWFDIEMHTVVETAITQVEEKVCLLALDILVAEDNAVNQIITVKLLENLGQRVTLVDNGLQALELLRTRAFDFVLMDCDMPVMDGYEAVKQWRREEEPGAHLPIVALTAHAYDGHEEKVKQCGMDGQLLKPVKSDELRDSIIHFTQDAAHG